MKKDREKILTLAKPGNKSKDILDRGGDIRILGLPSGGIVKKDRENN